MTEELKLEVGRVYRGKRPRNCSGLTNDRVITHIGWNHVQYDSPSVAMGRHYPSVTKEAFLTWAARDVTEEMPAGEWIDFPPPKPLTHAQIMTLRRLASGARYSLRGDGKKGIERRGHALDHSDHISATSLPPLYRLGLVEFTLDRGQEPTKYYTVKLSNKGREAMA